MKLMKIIPLYVMLVIFMLTLFIAITFGYAYFDTLKKIENSTIQIGEWNQIYYVDFEKILNATTNFEGKEWDTESTSRGSLRTDYYNGKRSLRMQKDSSFTSLDGFRAAQSVSFYFGKKKASPVPGKPYQVLISVNNSEEFIIVNEGNVTDDFIYLYIDISYIYTTGLNGVVIAPNSIINFKIIFQGGDTIIKNRQNMNVDDLTIVYYP